jgi:hypothetical protein
MTPKHVQLGLVWHGWMPPSQVAAELDAAHYLGASARGAAWHDEHGVIVFAAPTSRRLPRSWLELVRWCLTGGPNAGSKQWAAVVPELLNVYPDTTTVVSYSDPSAGHTGSLYRACGWQWAPTWHRLRPPPTGNGSWSDGESQGVKDRWVYLLRTDAERAALLAIDDASVLRSYPLASYAEPAWRNGRPVQDKRRMRAWREWRAARGGAASTAEAREGKGG